MRGSGFIGFIFVLVLAALIGTVAFQTGGPAELGGPAGQGDAVFAAWGDGGPGPFGLVLGVAFIVLTVLVITRLVAGPRMRYGPWSWDHDRRGSHRWAGHAGWGSGEVPEPFLRWHERAHRGSEDRHEDTSDDSPGARGTSDGGRGETRGTPPETVTAQQRTEGGPAGYPSGAYPPPSSPPAGYPPTAYPPAWPGQPQGLPPQPQAWPDPGPQPSWPYPGQPPQGPYPGRAPSGQDR